MSTGNVVISGNVSGSPVGNRNFGPSSIIANTAVDATMVVSLSAGANTITVPTGATVCVIAGPNAVNPIPNPTSAVVLTIKGVTGDTGIAISAKWPTLLSWDTAPATFVINATITATVELWFM